MNIAEVVSYGAIIWADAELGCLVTWNGSATFNFWVQQKGNTWLNTEVMTAYDTKDLSQAGALAHAWVAELHEEY
jgi:hypothetical protein